jgi:serine/threonine protein kinase
MEIGLIRDASTVIRGRNNYSEDSHSQRRHIPSFQEKCRMLRERLDLLEANSRMEIQRHRSRSTKSANPTHAIYRGHQPVWKMGHLRLKPLERLGKGASGVVFSAKYIQMSQQKEICESKEVAVKVIPLWQRPGFMREVEFMKALGPIGVSANLFATVETERSLILIMVSPICSQRSQADVPNSPKATFPSTIELSVFRRNDGHLDRKSANALSKIWFFLSTRCITKDSFTLI